MAALMVCVALMVFQTVCGTEQKYKKDGIIDHLNNGMKFAKDFLGSESIALKVAEFVVRAFQPPKTKTPVKQDQTSDNGNKYDINKGDENSAEENRNNNHINEAPNPLSPLRQIVRLFGLQPTQISAVAVNALVFVAQMISTFLAGPDRPNKSKRSGEPTDWVLNKQSRSLQDLISTAKNESLPDIIEDVIKQQGPEEETSCIRLLVCKITPFVTKMQKAVFGHQQHAETRGNAGLRGAAAMYKHLPSANEINSRSDFCERKHVGCNLNE